MEGNLKIGTLHVGLIGGVEKLPALIYQTVKDVNSGETQYRLIQILPIRNWVGTSGQELTEALIIFEEVE